MPRLIPLTLLCSVGLLALPRHADACSCAMLPACSAFYHADAVFIGQAKVVKTGTGSQRARFRVEESFRGAASKGGTIEIVGTGIGGSCAYEFVDGSRYLVYAKKKPDGDWGASLCSRTRLHDDDADDDLSFARQIARNPAGPGRVLGNASILEPNDRGELLPMASLAAVAISIRNASHSFTADTDPHGQFEFKDVPRGRYTLTVRLPPRFEPVPPAAVTVSGAGACATHSITVVRRQD